MYQLVLSRNRPDPTCCDIKSQRSQRISAFRSFTPTISTIVEKMGFLVQSFPQKKTIYREVKTRPILRQMKVRISGLLRGSLMDSPLEKVCHMRIAADPSIALELPCLHCLRPATVDSVKFCLEHQADSQLHWTHRANRLPSRLSPSTWNAYFFNDTCRTYGL